MIYLQSADSVCAMLGMRVRDWRLAQNLSQQELALKTSASLSSIRRLESSGQTTLNLLVRIAQALQATQALGELFVRPVQTIAQLEQSAAPVRQRARKAGKRAKA
jgi:transcriptional regulator with XRE-family HTH domain